MRFVPRRSMINGDADDARRFPRRTNNQEFQATEFGFVGAARFHRGRLRMLGAMKRLGFALLLASCAGRKAPVAPAPVVVQAPAAVPDSTAPPPVQQSSAFAQSPITPLADSIEVLTRALLMGGRLPDTGIELEPYSNAEDLVEMDERPDAEAFHSVLFDVRFLAVLLPEEEALPRTYGPQTSNAGAVEIELVLTRAGLKVGSVREHRWVDGLPLPAWLAGVAKPSEDVLAALQSKTLDRMLVGIDEKRILEPHKLWMNDRFQLMGDPGIRECGEIAAAAKTKKPLGYRGTEAVLWLVDGDAAWALRYELREVDGRIVLGTHPLVMGGKIR